MLYEEEMMTYLFLFVNGEVQKEDQELQAESTRSSPTGFPYLKTTYELHRKG